MSFSDNSSFKEKEKEIKNFYNIKLLLKEKNLNPKEINDLKYLLSLTINPKIRHFNLFNIDCLLIFLLNYLNINTLSIFTEYLFQSCELGSLHIVRILLENNLDINSRNELGETPLHIAVAKNDIKLIKLLIEYEPRTDIATYKDGLTVVNYAEFCGDKNIYKMIKELNENNIKDDIKNEVKDCINMKMENILENSELQDTNSLFKSTNKTNNIELIQNFNGEKISIITDSEMNSTTNILNNNNLINKYSISNIESKYINTQKTITNESDYNEDLTPNKKNIILFSKQVNMLNNKNNREIKFFSNSYRKKSISNNLSLNPSYFQSLTTCNSTNKEQTEVNNSIKFSKITQFITEINLSKEYSNNLIDNGFDNLDVLISQTIEGIALTYDHLKNIGIKKPGERIKILVHLEEISENFNFFIPKNIYSDELNTKNDSNSLKIFLRNINSDRFIDNFFFNGIYNIELLYIQMGSKQPLSEKILVNDLGIDKNDANKIIIKIYENSWKYIDKLKNMNKRNNKKGKKISNTKSIIYEEYNEVKSCDMCILF